MKRLMSKKNLLGAAGLSLIELIVSMAILATVGIAIGGAMYVTSRSYTRNSAEINVQEEAQVASNLICDWLVDAQEVTPDGAGVPAGTVSSTLEIKHWENGDLVTVSVFRSGSDLKYTAKNSAGSTIGEGVLASNVTGVSFTSKFSDTRNVQIAIDFDVNNRTYHSVTDSTSRNHDFIADATGANNARPIITFSIPPTRGSTDFDVFLEPGQNDTQHASFTFDATVYNYDPSNTTFTVTDSTGAVHDVTCTFVDNGTNVFPVTCTTTDHAKLEGTFTFTATKTVTDPINGTVSYLIDQKTLTVNVRRATECKFKDATGAHVTELGDADCVSGTPGSAGATYKPVAVGLGNQTYPQVPGAAYDSVFVDASTVKYYYRFADGTDASAYVEPVEVTSGSPSVQVRLIQNLPEDLYVVAVSTHQGDMPNSTGSYLVGTTGDNKLRRSPYDINNWSYYDSVGKDVTWDVFKIESNVPGNPPPFNFAEHGITRGTPSFEVGHMNDAYLTWLLNYLTGPTSSGGLGLDVNTVKNSYRYYTTIKYKEKGTGASWSSIDPYVVYCTNAWGNLNQHQMTQAFSAPLTNDQWGLASGQPAASNRNHNGYESFLFELTKAYDVEVTFSVYDNNNHFVCSNSSYTEVPAAQANIYDPNDTYKRFKTDTYDGSDAAHTYQFNYHSDNNGVFDQIYVYFDAVNMNYADWRINYRVEVGVENDSNHAGFDRWDDVTSTFNGYIQIDWKEGEFVSGFNKVRLPNSDPIIPYNEYTCRGYNENNYPDYGVNLEVIQLKGQAPFVQGNTYRIVFETNYPYTTSENVNNGILGGSNGQDGCVSSYKTDRTYTVSNSTDNTGYIYIQGNKPA